MMYDELIESLRLCVKYNKAQDALENAEQAADAIENTSKAYNMMAEAYEAEVTRQWWIPVTERLPKYGERVLVFGGVTMYVAYYDKNRYGGESS